MGKWRGYENGQTMKYEKPIEFYDTYDETSYKTKLSINMYREESGNGLVRSLQIGSDRLRLWQVPGEKYKSMIIRKNEVMPMKEEDLRHFLIGTVMPQLGNFTKARIIGRIPAGMKKADYLAGLRDRITDDMERYMALVEEGIESDWSQYENVRESKKAKPQSS
ncbi:MAG: hypothetical protein V1813_02150 [Candidatus Aenigmatarchaeota archaeon]